LWLSDHIKLKICGHSLARDSLATERQLLHSKRTNRIFTHFYYTLNRTYHR